MRESIDMLFNAGILPMLSGCIGCSIIAYGSWMLAGWVVRLGYGDNQ